MSDTTAFGDTTLGRDDMVHQAMGSFQGVFGMITDAGQAQEIPLL